jgi:glycine/sarcosine N-methyltransferase
MGLLSPNSFLQLHLDYNWLTIPISHPISEERAMYDAFSADYDRFVNWQERLSLELPFIIERLRAVQARQVLDVATGTGMHAIALAQCGFTACGVDLSPGMIERARVNARSAGVQVQFELAGFGTLAHRFGERAFDALLCLGNSLPHLLTLSELSSALADFAACLRRDGLLIIQNRNFDAVMARHDRWMEPQAHTEGDTRWLFQRFYDFDPDGLITFNLVTLKQVGQGDWIQSITTSRLMPMLKDDLTTRLEMAGFIDIKTFGNMAGATFDPQASLNLVIQAKLA